MGQIGTMGHPEVQPTVDGASTRSAHSDRVTGVLKDLFDVAGHVTTAGAHPGFRPPPARTDCEVVRRLRAAGSRRAW